MEAATRHGRTRLMPEHAGPHFVHATALVVRDAGVLIRGPSGSGKSSLAMRLIREAAREGWFARLVGDDRVSVAARRGAIVAHPHPALAGRIERRTLPLTVVPYERACVVRLVVDLMVAPPRLPEADCAGRATIDDVDLPLLQLEARNADVTAWLVLQALVSA